MWKKLALAFVIGSSIVATAISFLYLGTAFRRSGYRGDVSFEMVPLMVPIMFGLANVVLVSLGSGSGVLKAAMVGGALGLLFSVIGRFGLDLPRKLFRYDDDNAWQVHLIAVVLYAGIFTFIVRNVNLYFGLA